MNEPQDDRELEEYLSGQSPLSRRYRELGNEQPPPELDAKILGAARAESRVVPLRRRLQRWAPAIAVAATLLICLSLVIEIALPPAELPPDSVPTAIGPMVPEPPAGDEFANYRTGQPAARERTAAGLMTDIAKALDSSPAGAPTLEEMVVVPAESEAAQQALAGDWPDERQLAEAIDWIRAQAQAPAAETSGRTEPARAAEPAAEAVLAAILAAWEAGERETARERLHAFLAAFPEHPLSRELNADGDR